MTSTSIYKDIATRTGGDIYIGVVGPVRTGKSTFIKKFMESLVIPNIPDEYRRERAVDELPQSSAGKTIMTTEPKFIPDEAVRVVLEENTSFNVRMIDCVGYIVDSALGYIENEKPRKVMTPWNEREIDFSEAAEIGTKKVICEHSTIGLVVTTDGSIGEIPRSDYEKAEQRIIEELKSINKPFIILLNSMFPESQLAKELSEKLEAEYNVPVLCVNCIELNSERILEIIRTVLMEFPIKQISFDVPEWVTTLGNDHPLRTSLYGSILEYGHKLKSVREINSFVQNLSLSDNIESCFVRELDLGSGNADVNIRLNTELYYKIISETAGVEISSDIELIDFIKERSEK